MSLGKRSRLIEAHRVAQEFYAALLLDTGQPEARAGRDFLRERGFDGAAAERFGVGFAPRGGEALTRHLRERGFTEDEMVTGGLSGRGSRGLYDRFRGRLVWPIRDITGDTVGLRRPPPLRRRPHRREVPQHLRDADLQEVAGALRPRRREEGDRHRAPGGRRRGLHRRHGRPPRRRRGRGRHLRHRLRRRAHQDPAPDHARRGRRLAPARVIFTFDGDAAGQKAAMRAFGEDQRWAAQSFVAVAPDGMDPCELRHGQGGRRGARPRRRRRADVRVRRAHHDPALRPRHRRGPGRRR